MFQYCCRAEKLYLLNQRVIFDCALFLIHFKEAVLKDELKNKRWLIYRKLSSLGNVTKFRCWILQIWLLEDLLWLIEMWFLRNVSCKIPKILGSWHHRDGFSKELKVGKMYAIIFQNLLLDCLPKIPPTILQKPLGSIFKFNQIQLTTN